MGAKKVQDWPAVDRDDDLATAFTDGNAIAERGHPHTDAVPLATDEQAESVRADAAVDDHLARGHGRVGSMARLRADVQATLSKRQGHLEAVTTRTEGWRLRIDSLTDRINAERSAESKKQRGGMGPGIATLCTVLIAAGTFAIFSGVFSGVFREADSWRISLMAAGLAAATVVAKAPFRRLRTENAGAPRWPLMVVSAALVVLGALSFAVIREVAAKNDAARATAKKTADLEGKIPVYPPDEPIPLGAMFMLELVPLCGQVLLEVGKRDRLASERSTRARAFCRVRYHRSFKELDTSFGDLSEVSRVRREGDRTSDHLANAIVSHARARSWVNRLGIRFQDPAHPPLPPMWRIGDKEYAPTASILDDDIAVLDVRATLERAMAELRKVPQWTEAAVLAPDEDEDVAPPNDPAATSRKSAGRNLTPAKIDLAEQQGDFVATNGHG